MLREGKGCEEMNVIITDQKTGEEIPINLPVYTTSRMAFAVCTAFLSGLFFGLYLAGFIYD